MAWDRHLNRRLVLGGGAGLAMLGGYFALRGGSQGASHRAPDAGTFRLGNAAEPFTLDPTMSDATWENFIIGDLMMGLTTEDPKARPIPGMAERWETSPDGLTWTFHLREAQWSDGMPVTAEDFLFAWRRLLDPKIAASYAYYPYVIINAQAINAGHLPGSALGGARDRCPHPGSPSRASRALSAGNAGGGADDAAAAPCGGEKRQGLDQAGQLCRQRRLCAEGMDPQRSRHGGEESALLRRRQCETEAR